MTDKYDYLLDLNTQEQLFQKTITLFYSELFESFEQCPISTRVTHTIFSLYEKKQITSTLIPYWQSVEPILTALFNPSPVFYQNSSAIHKFPNGSVVYPSCAIYNLSHACQQNIHDLLVTEIMFKGCDRLSLNQLDNDRQENLSLVHFRLDRGDESESNSLSKSFLIAKDHQRAFESLFKQQIQYVFIVTAKKNNFSEIIQFIPKGKLSTNATTKNVDSVSSLDTVALFNSYVRQVFGTNFS